MKKIYFFGLIFVLMHSKAQNKINADLIVHHAKIYTANSNFTSAEAMVIKDGTIIDVGNNSKILNKYQAKESINAENKFIYPGFMDAHAHFFAYGSSLQNANLRNTKSWEEILNILIEFEKTHKEGWLLGRGWDQNDWQNKNFPTKQKLDSLFPNRPVYLTRIDGHAVIVNQKALDIAGINQNSEISGGEFIKENGKLTGVLIDNAVDKMSGYIPAPNEKQIQQIFLEAQKNCLSVGLTTVEDAGLDYDLVQEIQKLQKNKQLNMRFNIMLSDVPKNINWLIKNGKIKQDQLFVTGVKFYADGALGSRGACLLADYSDQPHHKGFLLSDVEHFKTMAKLMDKNGLQMNTHAIGDSANRMILKIYADVLKGKNDKRWRIEHAQVVNKKDFNWFGNYSIIPSVQPTHATSDMYWAKDRLGLDRLKYAYAYQDLWQQNQWIPLGTDFPIEEINPLLTFYAAVARKDVKGFPENGFQKENALTREQALKGITIWAAKAAFMEKNIGSLEVGKKADFVILNKDIMTVSENEILQTKVLETWINGKNIFITIDIKY